MNKNAYTLSLSIIITLFTVIASAGGLWIKDLYNDNDFVKLAWYSNDLITFYVVSPLLIIAIYLTKRGSQRWLMILMGLIGYVFYNFSFYLFGAAFNVFFLIYTWLVTMSAITIFIQLSNSDISSLTKRFSEKTPVKWVSLYLFLIALVLFSMELSMIIPFIVSGIIPDTIKLTGSSTSVVFALDFSIVIPFSIIAAILLWKRQSCGFILGVIMLIKGFTYGLVLLVSAALLAYSTTYGKWDPLILFYLALVVGSLLGCWSLLKNLEDSTTK